MSSPTALSTDTRPWCPPDWRGVELEEDEAITALRIGREAKWQSLKNSQYRWDIAHPPKAKLYSSAELSEVLLARAREQNPAFVLDKHNEAAWQFLCDYFAAEGNFSSSKGLLLIGPVGCGKTTMLRLFAASNPRVKFGVLPAQNVAKKYVMDGPDGLEPYLSAHYSGGVCFDDLGTEPTPVKHYGTECNALADVLEARYHEWEMGQLRGDYTHLTTNLPIGGPADEPSAPTLYGRYGRRVGDRLRDMFYLVAFSPAAPSRRGGR